MNEKTLQYGCDPLQKVARRRFGTLSAAEATLIQCAPVGNTAYVGSNRSDVDPNNDPTNADKWDVGREIRAELIRWICVDRLAKLQVDPKGIRIHGAKITGHLNLSYITIPFPVALWRCAITNPAQLESAEMPELDLAGTWTRTLSCLSLRVKGSVYLSDGFRAEGGVDMSEAIIGSSLICDGGKCLNAPGTEESDDPESGFALDCNRINVAGNVCLRQHFYAEGEVRFLNARIGGNFDCTGATIHNPRPQNAEEAKFALQAEGITVQGTVSFSDDFYPVGAVGLAGARIGGVLDFRNSNFTLAELDLRDTAVGSLMDDAKSWPVGGKVRLDGLVYERISAGPRTADERLPWLALQREFRTQPYHQLAKVLRAIGDDEGAIKVLAEMEHLTAMQTLSDHVWRPLYSATVGYGYRPLRAFWELAGLSALGWILYRRSYLAGNIVPVEKDAYDAFKREGSPPAHYPGFAPVIYSLENSIPLVKLGQGDKWQPEPGNKSSVAQAEKTTLESEYQTNRKRRGFFDRLLIVCGLRSECGAGNPPSRASRFGTSGQFIRWFLWSQILLGWLLATLFLAGVTQIVRTQ